jgi:hypothetical protein
MSGAIGGEIRSSGPGDATLFLACSIIWQGDFDERQSFPHGVKESSWRLELTRDDRAHPVRVSRG